jgi:hypothetical protein
MIYLWRRSPTAAVSAFNRVATGDLLRTASMNDHTVSDPAEDAREDAGHQPGNDTPPRVIADDDVAAGPPEVSVYQPGFRKFRHTTLLLAAVGAVVQLLLSAYYLSIGHAPAPHNLPVAVVAAAEQQSALRQQIERGGNFKVTFVDDAATIRSDILRKDIYGGLDLSATRPHLYVASAAGTGASNVIKTTFTSVMNDQVAQKVKDLQAAGDPVPLSTVQQLTAPPDVTDVAPLPSSDTTGGSVGLLIQALALGATVAALGLGRLVDKRRRSLRRGAGHVVMMVVYSLVSAAVVLMVAGWFGVPASGASWSVFFSFLLVSLAITGSTAAFVSLFGPAGALVGTMYFTLGVIISGSSILPEFLPGPGRAFGQALPTGAGVAAIRDSLYFPDAPIGTPLTVLGLYAGLGLAGVLIINTMPVGRSDAS